ncbi:MAG: ABC transporter permease, partial [Thermoanaerobaculia bacterium]
IDPRGVLTLRLRIPQSMHPESSRVEELWRLLPGRIESLPRVHSAGLVNYLPMQGTSLGTRAWAADTAPREGFRVEVRGVGGRYFRGMGIPLLAGRDFTAGEVAEDRPVIVVSEAAAGRLWPGEAAVGQRLSLDWMGRGAREVVGVVGNVKHHGVTAATDPAVYLPFGQAPHSAMTLVVRTAAERPARWMSAIRTRVSELDVTFVIDQVRTLPEVVGATLTRPRSQALALAAFALVSVLLSAGGAYSVVAYSVARRRHDFSVRLALGAHPRDLVKGVAAEGLRDAVFGVGIGLILFVFIARWLSDLLFGVRPGDPWVLTAMSVLMISVAWVAAYLPARQAAGIDPAPSLRAV